MPPKLAPQRDYTPNSWENCASENCLRNGIPYRIDYSKIDPYPAKPSLLRLFQKRAETLDEEYHVFQGAMLSGGARIFSETFLREIVTGVPKVEGGMIVRGEMEGVGLLSVSPRNEPLWIIAKGICDFADHNRDRMIAATRPIACRNAASFVLSALEETPNYL